MGHPVYNDFGLWLSKFFLLSNYKWNIYGNIIKDAAFLSKCNVYTKIQKVGLLIKGNVGKICYSVLICQLCDLFVWIDCILAFRKLAALPNLDFDWNSKSVGTLVPTNCWKDKISPLRWPWYEYATGNYQRSYFELWCCGLHCGLLDLRSRYSIYIRTVISWHLFSVLHNGFELVYGQFWHSNMNRTLDCPVPRPARKETN